MSFMLRRPDGMILMQSDGADPAVFGSAPRQGFREQGDHRIFGLLAADDTFLEVAGTLEERRSAASR